MVERYEANLRKEIKKGLLSNPALKLERWERYRELKEAPIPEPETIVKQVVELSKIHLKIAAAISLLLLTGSRIKEVVRYRWVWVRPQKDEEGKKIPMDYESYKELKDVIGEVITKPAIKIEDIEEKEKDEKMWFIIKTRVEKYHDVSKTFYKYAWLLYDESEYYYPLIKIVEDYVGSEFSNAPLNTELFEFSDDYLRQELKKYLNLPPHILRNYVAKWLVWKKGFNVQDLMKWFQWKGVEQALSYSSSDENALRRKMLGDE